MSDTFGALKAVWAPLWGSILRGQLFNPQCELTDPDPDIEAIYDVEIPMSEGYALTANIFRSRKRHAAGEKDPVVMCAHPYDNHLIPALNKTPLGGPPHQYRFVRQGGKTPKFSTQTSWESPDPNFWVPAGYTLINLNLPGFANSGGPASIFSQHQGRCYREAIAWAGDQEWSNGAVGLSGVSYLAISQYYAAATPDGETAPQALKCIIPWEGFSNIYHDVMCRGGVPEVGFMNFWWHTEVKGPMNNSLEEYLATEGTLPMAALGAHPFYDDYWQAKIPALENIRVPMLVCASFSDHELHTYGSLRAFEKAKSDQKWLYTHRSGKWTEFYKPEVSALQKEFMDHFLKGADTQFGDCPPVRIEVRSARDEVTEVRWEDAWPLTNTNYTPLYLQKKGRLDLHPMSGESDVAYDAVSGQAVFDFTFPEDTELTGYMKLRLWVSARAKNKKDQPPDDILLCCFVDKRGRSGRSVRFYGTGGQHKDMLSRGYGRAAWRALNEEDSTPWHPVPLGTKDEKLAPGEVVPIEIAICPSSTFFAKGERLRLIVSATDIVHNPVFKKDVRANHGRHVLHIGGKYDSHLLVPRIEQR